MTPHSLKDPRADAAAVDPVIEHVDRLRPIWQEIDRLDEEHRRRFQTLPAKVKRPATDQHTRSSSASLRIMDLARSSGRST